MSDDLSDLRRRAGIVEAEQGVYWSGRPGTFDPKTGKTRRTIERPLDSSAPEPEGQTLGAKPEIDPAKAAQDRVAIKRRARQVLIDAGIDLSKHGLDIR